MSQDLDGRNMLFGALAFHQGHVREALLVEAMSVVEQGAARTLRDALVAKGFLDAGVAEGLDTAVDTTLDRHRGDVAEAMMAVGFDALFRGIAGSAVMREVWLEAYGDEYPDGCEPFSFVTRTELGRLASALAVDAGSELADLGCGRGGPGLWVARETGAALVGVDISAEAIRQAAARAVHFGLEGRARFVVGAFSSTGLPDGSVDAAMSVDALQIAPDRAAAFREAARIIRPGGRFAFTTAEDLPGVASGPRQRVEDNRPLLLEAGFRVLAHEPHGSEKLVRTTFAICLRRADELRRELGSIADLLLEEARGEVDAPSSRRVMVVAER